jgi:putative membrane protein
VTSPDEPDPAPVDLANQARDHLANERTYLAWLRTAVAVMALGLGIAGFAHTTTTTTVVAGAILVLAGTAGVCYGTVRYRQITDDLAAGRFRAGRRGRAAGVTSGVLLVAVFAALITLVVGRR